jgi:hypothetical protein
MLKVALIVFVAGLYLIGSGCYELFVQAGTSRQPTTVSVAELEKGVPANRHLIITGGRPVSETAITFYRKKWGTKISGSEILFIPIMDASGAATDRSTPPILLRVTEDQLDLAKAGQKVNFRAMEGIRTTSMDLEDKARRRLVESYGDAAVKRMIVLDYHGKIGLGAALGKMVGGVAMVGAVVAGFIFVRRPKQAPPPIPGSVPPVIAG